MKMIQFKLAELRKKRGVTQQELSLVVNTSFQTISKWENGVTLPDITVLPILAEYFGVTVDELLGLVPLKDEVYVSEGTDTKKFWDERLEYLLRTRKEAWNHDYLEFLIQRVWKIDKPVNLLDCGCGYGYMGLLLMPLLPEGSTYTGVDFSDKMIQYAQELYARSGIEGRFIQSDFLQINESKKYDVVLCQSVLRHVGDSAPYIEKMLRLAKRGALLICIDSNRELECAGLYVDGMDYTKLCNHEGAAKHWKCEYDRVSFVHPECEEYKKRVEDFFENHRVWQQDEEKVLECLMSHGLTRKEAENYSQKMKRVEEHYKENTSKFQYTKFNGKTITFGWKE